MFLFSPWSDSIVPITAQAQSNMPAPQNQLRTPQADGMRQPIDPNSQRGQQPGIAGGAQRVPTGQANQPSGGTLPNGAPAQPQPLYAAPPFVLSPQEEAELDGLLKAWEKQSQGVKYFYCEFNRLEYNPAFAGGNPNQLTTESHGEIKFAAPDKGLFRVTAISNYVLDPKTREIRETDGCPDRVVDLRRKVDVSSRCRQETKYWKLLCRHRCKAQPSPTARCRLFLAQRPKH